MLRYFFLVYVIVLINGSCGNPMTNEISCEQELLLAFVVNRHGERTPDADELSLSDEQERIKNLTRIEGLEGLTNSGKRRAYQIGKYLRQRYGSGSECRSLISPIYLRDEISIRSTDKERTKMTVQVAMAAVYPPETEQQWDEGVGKVWQPVPYTALPLTEDYLRYYANCERFKELMSRAKEESVHEEFVPYDDLIPFLIEKTGRNFTENPLLFETQFDLFRSLVGLGLDIPEWATPILSRLSEAGRLAYRLFFRNDEMKKIGGGVILNDFIQASLDIISGKKLSPRLYLFSGHDFNIGALMDVARVRCDHSIPEYGAVFSLELYKSKRGDYSVVPVFLPQAGESTAQTLRIMGCENSNNCDFRKFQELTKEFLLPEKEFYRTCNIRTEL